MHNLRVLWILWKSSCWHCCGKLYR